MNKEQEIMKFVNEELKIEVRTIYNEDGSIGVNLGDIAIGLGMIKVDKKNGKEYIRPNVSGVNKHLKDFGISDSEYKKDDFIPESALYLLGMKANNKVAQNFQLWLATEVIPNIRKHGAYISNNEDDVDQGYIKYTYGQLKNTFINCPIESLIETYDECMEFHKKNKTRIPYANNSKRRKNATHSISDTKIMIMEKIITILESRNLSLMENGKFGLCSELNDTIKDIKDDIKKQNNISNRGKLGQATKKINKLKDEVKYYNPNLEEFLEIPKHGYSTNYLFESYIYNGKLSMRKSDGYNKWINSFPNDLIIDSFSDIDLSKPTKLWLKFDCKEGIDSDNLIKSIQDQIVRALNAKDDNNIQLGSVEVNKRIKTYSEGRIYMLLKNV